MLQLKSQLKLIGPCPCLVNERKTYVIHLNVISFSNFSVVYGMKVKHLEIKFSTYRLQKWKDYVRTQNLDYYGNNYKNNLSSRLPITKLLPGNERKMWLINAIFLICFIGMCVILNKRQSLKCLFISYCSF